MSADLLEISDNKITGYNGTAFADQGGVTGDYELSAGSGISIVDFPLEQKTVISVTAQGGNPEVEQAVIDNSATWDSVTSKADVTAIPSLEGYATENWVTSQGYLTGVDLTPYQTTAGMTAYATIESLTAKQDAGNYLSATDSANFLLTSDSGNFYPMNENPSGYLTAHQDLSNYATTAQLADKVDSSAIGIREASVNLVSSISGMRLSAWTADNASYASTAGRANRDSLGNIITATYISEVPDTYLQNTDLSTTDGKVTAISGIPLSAGTELEFEYDAADNISAINSSAISTTPAQALYAQNPLYFSATGTSSYMGINSADLARMLGVDETVLYSGELSVGQTAALTENYSAFRKLEFKYRPWSTADNGQMKYEQFGTEYGNWQTLAGWSKNNLKAVFIGVYSATDINHIKLTSACFNNITATNAWADAAANYRLFEIRGIGRKEV